MNHIVRNFIIGSSFPILLPFYFSVPYIENKNYQLKDYILIAPIYLGIFNVLINTYIPATSFILKGIISASIVFIFALYMNSYNFNTIKDKIHYIGRLMLRHIFAFYTIDQLSYFIS